MDVDVPTLPDGDMGSDSSSQTHPSGGITDDHNDFNMV